MRRTIEVSTRGTRLSLEHKRVVISRDDEVLARIPAEDLGLIVLDTSGVSISSGVLQALSRHGGALLACDGSHHPLGLLLPVAANSLHVERLRHQAAASVPLQKQTWRRIVQAKVRNQAEVVPDAASREALLALAEKVKSGDASNVEARAARLYWSRVFLNRLPEELLPFRRKRDGAHPNGLLNYGYAVLRAATARALCGAGLHPALGLHHHNRYSGFALADDLMEPFRPWVDAIVSELAAGETYEVDKEGKRRLLEVLSARVRTAAGVGPLSAGLERSAATLAQAIGAAATGSPALEAARIVDLPRWVADGADA